MVSKLIQSDRESIKRNLICEQTVPLAFLKIKSNVPCWILISHTEYVLIYLFLRCNWILRKLNTAHLSFCTFVLLNGTYQTHSMLTAQDFRRANSNLRLVLVSCSVSVRCTAWWFSADRHSTMPPLCPPGQVSAFSRSAICKMRSTTGSVLEGRYEQCTDANTHMRGNNCINIV